MTPQKLNKQHLLDILKEHDLYCEERSTTMELQLQQAFENAALKVSRAMFGWLVSSVLEANGLSFIAVFI